MQSPSSIDQFDPPVKGSQAAAILARLMETPGIWVPMPELAALSGAYAVHSRISDLRKRGYHIETKVVCRRPKHSFYRIILPR
jgi:hypothetical protein